MIEAPQHAPATDQGPARPAATSAPHDPSGGPTGFTSQGAIPAVASGWNQPAPTASERAYDHAGADDELVQGHASRTIDGVTVFAGNGCHRTAIDVCAEFIHEEIGRNKLAQKKLAKARATIVIIPAASHMTDLPQFSHLKGQKTFDGRPWEDVRGSGGMDAPDGSFAIGVAEENLIAVKGVVSSYPVDYSIGMHEFAHALNTHGMTAEQQARVQQLYFRHLQADPGDKNDTFTEHYGASNALEYFAQGTNAFFGRNTLTGSHNGRAWLQQHDPDLYAFLVEMYETDYDEKGHRVP